MGTSVDHNKECWSGFFKTEELAQKELEKATAKLAEKKNIVSAKKELQEKKFSNELIFKLKEVQKSTITQGMLLYKFTIITAKR
jgi:hypothetical protein